MAEAKGKPAPPPFDDFLVYGPIMHKSEGRRMVVLVHRLEKRRTSMSYARYLMSTSLGRVLLKSEHVDHKDDNKLNDVISNLQILTPLENSKKSARPRTMVQLTCSFCSKDFERRKGQEPALRPDYKNTYCSRKCLGSAWQKAQAKVGFKAPNVGRPRKT